MANKTLKQIMLLYGKTYKYDDEETFKVNQPKVVSEKTSKYLLEQKTKLKDNFGNIQEVNMFKEIITEGGTC